ncbi:MAG: MCE family protein [Sediminibacterium sp.]|nr:MCE family protein [Sediminibacterium sp.]MBP6144059.1 MCE family protein [Sediminibacterium sp.]
MRVSNETKVGALTVIAVTLIILGFNFLKGKTFFKSGSFLYAKYTDTKGLIVSNPVFVNGFQVGTVFEIENMNDNLSELVVCIKLNQLYKIPKNSVATIQENPLGTNAINIVPGNSTMMVLSGDTIKTAPAASLLGDFMNTLSPLGEQIKNTITSLEKVLGNVNKTLDDENRQNFKVILANLSTTTANLDKSIQSVEGMLNKQNGSIAKTADNINSFTANLNQNNQKISNILTNLDSTTKSIKDADLNKTIKDIQTALVALNTTINKLNNGNGTAAKLLNDPNMYTQLQSTIKSVNTLVDDIKVHPKRYVSLSVFGKKDKSVPLAKPLSDSLAHD